MLGRGQNAADEAVGIGRGELLSGGDVGRIDVEAAGQQDVVAAGAGDVAQRVERDGAAEAVGAGMDRAVAVGVFDGVGVNPDLVVDRSLADFTPGVDRQLRAALLLLREAGVF